VYVGCRSKAAGKRALEVIRAEVPNADNRLLDLELSDLGSVRACTKSFLEYVVHPGIQTL
jgi:hypothetical protein